MFKHLGVKCNSAKGRQIEREWVKGISLFSTSCLMETFYFSLSSSIYAISRPSLRWIVTWYLEWFHFHHHFHHHQRRQKWALLCKLFTLLHAHPDSAQKNHFCMHWHTFIFHVHATANELTKLNSLLNLLDRYQCKCDNAIRHCLSRSLSLSLCQREYKVITALI